MNKKLPDFAFCENCGERVTFTLGTCMEHNEVRGIKFSCEALRAFCDKCGDPVYVPEVNDINVDIRAQTYKKVATNLKLED